MSALDWIRVCLLWVHLYRCLTGCWSLTLTLWLSLWLSFTLSLPIFSLSSPSLCFSVSIIIFHCLHPSVYLLHLWLLCLPLSLRLRLFVCLYVSVCSFSHAFVCLYVRLSVSLSVGPLGVLVCPLDICMFAFFHTCTCCLSVSLPYCMSACSSGSSLVYPSLCGSPSLTTRLTAWHPIVICLSIRPKRCFRYCSDKDERCVLGDQKASKGDEIR